MQATSRSLLAVALAGLGLTLLGWAALDWAGYTSFTVSLIWR